MKKLFIFLLCLVSIFSLAACSKDETNVPQQFKPIGEKTLFVGSSEHFTNLKDEIEEKQYLAYLTDITYTLYRTSYNQTGDAVLVDGYYYYWDSTPIYDEHYLGTCKTTTTTTYSYLTFGEKHENVTVKMKRVTEKSYDYQSGFINKPFTHTTYLNGYFTSFDKLKEASPVLAAQIDTSGSKKYYVDTTYPTRTTTNTQSYTNTYFYFE